MARRRKDQPTRFCLDCGYALYGLSANRCPECGRPFNPRDRKTWAGPEPKGWRDTVYPWLEAVAGYTLASLGNGFAIAYLVDLLLVDLGDHALSPWGWPLSLGMLALFVSAGRAVPINTRAGDAWGSVLWSGVCLTWVIDIIIDVSGWALSLPSETTTTVSVCVSLTVFWAFLGIIYAASRPH